jgi:U3 small nucleolar RNA-associated protein 18
MPPGKRRAASAAAAPRAAAAPPPRASSKRSRAERDALLAASHDATDAALEAAVFGAAPLPPRAAPAPAPAAASRGAAAAAWHDDDDEDVRVDVAAVARLRKLRHAPSEATLTGAQLSERLRAQFAKSAGGAEVPEWARLPAQRAARRRAAGSDDDSGSDDGSGDDDGDGDNVGAAAATAAADDDDDGEAAFRTAGSLAQAPGALAPGRLSIARLRDANRSEPSRAVVQAVGWHPSGSVMFTAGLDKKLRFFAVDGKRNPKVASVHFPDLPIAAAAWNGDGSEVLLAGRRSHFYAYSVESGAATRVGRLLGCDDRSLESMVVSPAPPGAPAACVAFLGNNGAIVLASARTKQRMATLKMNGSVRAAAFTRDPLAGPGGGAGAGGELDQLLTVGGHGEVYRWDLRTMRCVGRHADEGSTGSTALAATPDGRFYAVGAKSGVVNVYDAAAVAGGGGGGGGGSWEAPAAGAGGGSVRGLFASAHAPAPARTYMNLTTPITALAYTRCGSVLAMASDAVRDALKLAHTASGTVFSNWPTSKTPLHYVSAVAFSPGGGFVTVANDRGRVLLYRLAHFSSV